MRAARADLDRLWAPWRSVYVTQPMASRCIFCAAKRSRQNAPVYVVHRARRTFALLNRFPYNAGHLMVSSYRHVGALARLTSAERAELWDLTLQMTERLGRLLRPDGFNVGLNLGRAAGAGIAGHVHLHVVPRWIGDTNFMPVLGRTKVVSASLDELYRQLIRLS